MHHLINAIPGIWRPICRKGAFYTMANIARASSGKKHAAASVIDRFRATSRTLLLESKYVAVVPGKSFGEDSHVRLSYATSSGKIKRGMDRMAEFVSELE